MKWARLQKELHTIFHVSHLFSDKPQGAFMLLIGYSNNSVMDSLENIIIDMFSKFSLILI
jgi:hypothetical protein